MLDRPGRYHEAIEILYQGERIVTAGEWDQVSNTLDKRVKELLDRKFEVELE